jgi:hypothetical protein
MASRTNDFRLVVPYENIELSDSYIDQLLDAVFMGVAPA